MYRKIYLLGAIFLAIELLTIFIAPLFYLSTCIGCGITAKYFYCKKFITDLSISGYPDKDINDIENNLRILGGYNKWAIGLYVVWIVVTTTISLIYGAIGLAILNDILH